MYLTEKEEILHLRDENKELIEQVKRLSLGLFDKTVEIVVLKNQIKKMNINMNDMWREILILKPINRKEVCKNTMKVN